MRAGARRQLLSSQGVLNNYRHMNPRLDRRLRLNLTQSAAALRAGLSLATWRRWEEDPDSVSAKTREACERVLREEAPFATVLSELAARFERSWFDCSYLTPRQAYSIAMTLNLWADGEIRDWVRAPGEEPLHEVSPFHLFDRRVLIHVNENRAWAENVRERCYAIADEIGRGVLPFDRPGAYIDELLVGAALRQAEDQLTDMPELFGRIPPRAAPSGDDDGPIGDEEWGLVSDAFDDMCRWDEWEIPLYVNHPLLPAILAERHPFCWFDVVPPTGQGHLQGRQGLLAPPAGEGGWQS
jgi:transcriptional regulator with XRE-family HTH domain